MIERKETAKNTFDLTKLPNVEISKILKYEIETEHVFHGTNYSEQITELQTRQANDTHRESGSQNAIYASEDIQACTFKATFNNTFMKSKLDSFTVGWDGSKDGITIKADPKAFQIIKNNYYDIFTDGWIYSFDKKDFILSEGTNSEYHSLKRETPQKSFRIPGTFAEELFYLKKEGESTIVEYSQEEMEEINKHINSQNGK